MNDKRKEFRLEQAVRHARGNPPIPTGSVFDMDANDDGTPYMGDYSPAHDIFPPIKSQEEINEERRKTRIMRKWVWRCLIVLCIALWVGLGSMAFGQTSSYELPWTECGYDRDTRRLVIHLRPELKGDAEGTAAAIRQCRAVVNTRILMNTPDLSNGTGAFDQPKFTPQQ